METTPLRMSPEQQVLIEGLLICECRNDLIETLGNQLFIDPATEQVGIKLDDERWLYSEIDSDGYRATIMDFADYTEKDLENGISGYYANLEEVKEAYGDDWKQIVLECLFEQMA